MEKNVNIFILFISIVFIRNQSLTIDLNVIFSRLLGIIRSYLKVNKVWRINWVYLLFISIVFIRN